MSSSNSAENMDILAAALQLTRVTVTGVSFAGKSLKLDTENDAKVIVEEINNCKHLEYLNLEGNTMGVEASKAIAVALEKHPEFKKALWKDMFTGRLKTEIPKSLEYFGESLVKAGSRLTVLDLSDNAFGPIGIKGLAALLESSSCYALEELRLNNNGLGITGGTLLAEALTNCYKASAKEGKPLALKVFIAGRNRLENDGAKALAAVFKTLGSLEEIAMPQNGIYATGIEALFDSFIENNNLKILNLNDNTFGEQSSELLAKTLPNLVNLKVINFGDCLLKNEGALALAKALKSHHTKLEELNLSSNEIELAAGLAVVKAMDNKLHLKELILCGNEFRRKGVEKLRDQLKNIGKLNISYKLNDNIDSDDEGDLSGDESATDDDYEGETSDAEDDKIAKLKPVSIEEFLTMPNEEHLSFLESTSEEQIINRIMAEKLISADKYVCAIMKLASCGNCKDLNLTKKLMKIADQLFKDLFTWGQKNNSLSLINNSILVNLQLIKSEDKKLKPAWNITGCYHTLKNLVQSNIIPESTKQILALFIENKIEKLDAYTKNEFLPLLKENK